ncbi:MAG: hypothetical protein LQ342_006118 [Letrouitia transgressa]|nr:MAG: hypothetical protein LQ342_006118 [Letrouitia transgressa]
MSASDLDSDSGEDMDAKPPVHPVPQMQGAFEESMMETLNESEDAEPEDRMSKVDSVSRRKMLLEQEQYERTVAGRWKQKPGEQFHPLWKLVAQISFGMHLLQQGLAKSDEEVIKLLQMHVNEIDGFLERTTEDFDLAQGDIDDRIRYLKLPLEHRSVFDTMLSERNFRTAIVEGNEKIEHIIDRTAAAMNDALKDVQKGLDATRELAKYLTRVDKQWEPRTEEHDSVYLAMIGNTEGWTRAFLTLQSKGNTLRRALVQLGGIVAEMQRRAAAASRKNLVPVRTLNGRYIVEPQPPSPNRSASSPRSPMKPLPDAPHTIAPRIPSQSNSHRSHQSTPRDQSQQSTPKHHSKQSTPKLQKSSKGSPRVEPSSPRIERAMSGKRMAPILRDTTPEPTKPPKSPEPPMPPEAREESIPIQIEEAAPSEHYGTAQLVNGIEPKPPIPERSPERSTPQKPSFSTFTDRARFHLTRRRSSIKENEESPASRGREGTVLANGDSEKQGSSTDLPIQNPPGHNSVVDRPSSPLARRPSTRNTNAVSMSTYSSSPTSTVRPPESPLLRETSPPLLNESGGPRPSHNSYESISFLPLHPQLSPLPDYSNPSEQESIYDVRPLLQRSASANSMNKPRRSSSVTSYTTQIRRSSIPSTAGLKRSSSASSTHQRRSPSIRAPKQMHIPDDAGGSVNTQHPLLREARHARLAASPTSTGTPSRTSSRDLPLRHYHSQENFHTSSFGARQKDSVHPKRTSSLLYDPPSQFLPTSGVSITSSPLKDQDRLSPAPANTSATPSPLNVNISRPDTAASNRDVPESASTVLSTTDSDNELEPAESATPPPIGRSARSPTPTSSRFDSNIRSPTSRSPGMGSPHIRSPTSTSFQAAPSPSVTHPTHSPEYKTSATNNIPFYLNPTSSAALIDFLASTPPPSPPRPARSQTMPNTTDTELYRNYRVENSSAAVPTGPGGVPMLPLNLAQARSVQAPSPTNEKKGGWKRMFGAGRKSKGAGAGMAARDEEPKKGAKTKMWRKREREGVNGDVRVENGHVRGMSGGSGRRAMDGDMERANAMGGAGGDGPGESFMGMGNDGVWISRKNFLKT